ncbi:hypothetical protein BDP27DRAFT_1423931 [Rhodocollybia butyracea]|uniref:Uncharacterized protein n=1 Tax=Rhodocollybia butyracea TaxID=206335 RepID=A0A9P5PR10_9AGAR|nr:hypothetical protein BDP27DRAFT_1423931 [Rhodocollybia butyracea]
MYRNGFPGAGFKRKAEDGIFCARKMTEDPFRVTKERTVAGTATSSLASVALEQIEPTKDIAQQEELIKAASAMAHVGGTDTIVMTMGSFILVNGTVLEVLMRTANKIKAMLMNPDIQTEAQRELDRVLAPGDLPTFPSSQIFHTSMQLFERY